MRKKQINQQEIDATVMLIRELLMEYFKGTCIERMTTVNNVYVESVRQGGQYNYQRREARNRDVRQLYISGIPILEMQHNDDTITLFTKVLRRSPEFKAVEQGILKFLNTYLLGVKVKNSRKGVFYANY